MLRHRIRLSDGTVLESGTPTDNAIIKVKLTEEVNDNSEEDLMPGAASTSCLELELLIPEGNLQITHGDEVELWRVDTETQEEVQVGIFLAEQPTKSSANKYKVTAYDRMTLLDKDLSPWLREQQGNFPMTLEALVQAVVAACGLQMADATLDKLPNSNYRVQAFYDDGITGRKIIRWAAQALCRFARMTPAGLLEFAWYTGHARSGIGPGDGAEWTALDLSGQLLATVSGEIWTFNQPQAGYLSGTLSYEDYETAPIDKVQIKQTDDDVGVIYPPDEPGTNALVIQGNLLLTTQTADALRPVAQAIYEQMRGVVYTPLQVSIPLAADAPVPGEIITVSDAYGHHMLAYIMQRTISGQRVTLESTGNARRDGTSAVNSQKWQNLQGKVLEIQTSVDGLAVKASELEGDYTELSQTVEGLSVSVVKDGEVRTKFALDDTSVTINAGVIAFQSDSISIDSQNFQLETNGNVTATGIFRSNNGVSGAGRNESILSSGGLQLYRTLNNGQNTIAASLSSDGQNASMGHFALYGSTGVQMLTADADFAGMRFVLRNGNGHGMITMSPTNGGSAEFEGNVDVQGSIGLGVSTTVSCQTLHAWGSKDRVVLTARGYVGMGAMESPQPAFADFGCGVCDDDGLCLLQLDPRYLDTVAAAYAPRWSVTATAPGQLWLEKRGQDALVHGAAGQTFDWIVIIPQRGYENQYAEPVDGSPPPAQVPSRDVADVLPGTIDPPSDIIPNTDTIAASQSLAAERRPA